MNKTYDKLTDFFHCKVETFARKKLNYSEANLLILTMNEERLKNEYPEIWNNIISCVTNRDSRTSMEYARDVVSSWVFEDYFVKKVKSLKIKDFDIELSGGDKERNFLDTKKVSGSSDTFVHYKDKTIKVEIVNDYTGFWYKTKMLHLRNHKYQKLKDEKALLLGVDICNVKYILLNMTDNNLQTKHIESHKIFGGKEAEQIDLDRSDFHDFWIKDVIENIIAIM